MTTSYYTSELSLNSGIDCLNIICRFIVKEKYVVKLRPNTKMSHVITVIETKLF